MSTLIVNNEHATIEQKHFAQFHGNSVFTTMKWSNGVLHYWSKHWQRLSEHAAFFSFSMPEEKSIVALINEALKQSPGPQKIRIIVGIHGYAITIEELSPYDARIYEGVSVIRSSFQVHSQLAHLKTANSLPYMLARQEAERNQVFEALLSNNDGYIVDGSKSSLLLFKNDLLLSAKGGLKGIMREEAISFAKARGVFVKEQFMRYKDLEGELLLTNSLFGIVSVGPPSHPFIKELIDYFRT